MFYRIKDDKVYDYADYQYEEDSIETDLCTMEEYREKPYKWIVQEVEEEIDVPDFETVEIEVEIHDTDEEGNYIYDEEGNPVTHKETRTVTQPVMIEYEDTETVIDYDEEGNPIGSHEITVIKTKQKTHKETVTVQRLVLNPDWEQEEAKLERERLDALTLTPSDVERALYYSELNMDFDDLKFLISQQAPQIDLKGLAIEFRANNFYRGAVDKDGNRIIDMVGMLLGYDTADMDYLFEHKQLPTKGTQNEG